MDNASKALYMAGSLLIALLVISLLVYTFTNLGGMQNQKDIIQSEEEISAFNTEYEAFNKKIMYGVDVISCINKAINHNEKYVNGIRSNSKYGDEALINVEVKLKDNGLKESIEVYHFDSNGSEKKYYDLPKTDQKVKHDSSEFWIGNLKWKDIIKSSGFCKTEISTKPDSLFFTSIEDNFLLKDIYKSEYKKTLTSSKLLSGNVIDKTDYSLYNLVRHSNELEIIITNKDDQNNKNQYGWSYIKWTTCLADFKKRKFKCTGFEYSSETGLVCKIVFSEI